MSLKNLQFVIFFFIISHFLIGKHQAVIIDTETLTVRYVLPDVLMLSVACGKEHVVLLSRIGIVFTYGGGRSFFTFCALSIQKSSYNSYNSFISIFLLHKLSKPL